jgi:hypothetical protein
MSCADLTKPLLLAHLTERSTDQGYLSEYVLNTDNLDALCDFQKTLLPLMFKRAKFKDRSIANFEVIRGMYRNMVVRNRVLVAESKKLMTQLRDAGIDAFVFKSGALLGRFLPSEGLRPIADIDVWVRPRQYKQALEVLGFGSRLSPHVLPRSSEHAKQLIMPNGLELDLHMVPSHWHAARLTKIDLREQLFETAWQSRLGDQLSNSDLLYFSSLNPLFAHGAGHARSAFALLELDAILAHSDITEDDLQTIRQRVKQDGSAAIFLEHHEWLSRGESPAIDHFIDTAIAPEANQKDVAVARWLMNTAVAADGGNDTSQWIRFHVRRQALACRSILPGQRGACVAVLRWMCMDLTRNPGLLFVWLCRKQSWRRLWRTSCHLFKTRWPMGIKQ